MAPPSYPDLGKLARDLFRRGYHPGVWQLDCKSMSSPGIEFFTTGFASQDHSKVAGSLQSKYKIEDSGLTLTERWNTDSWFFGEIVQKDKLAQGLMLGLEGRFQPSSDSKDGKFKLGYVEDHFNFLTDMGISSSPIMNCSLVLGHKEFLGGLGCTFDLGDTSLSSWKVALGWSNDKATLHGELKDGDSWLASLFYKLNDQIDAAVELTKTGGGGGGPEPAEGEAEQAGGSDVTVGVGMIYRLEGDALIRAKINSKAELGLGYEQKVREGITASISAVLDGRNISDGNHKFGVGLALEC
ncbi:voltage-dependent anion-selective channel [Drosophila pseudoobscura]|uniref:Voltage-dependent anion-selective channel n=1 Tax=Drosophila pseudoobscura pseudoobscura TaxID=46245 RepID=Q29KP3_DROPS|nr:voltage-dependent anion-selective channel [Drosophila pseudoobscura]